ADAASDARSRGDDLVLERSERSAARALRSEAVGAELGASAVPSRARGAPAPPRGCAGAPRARLGTAEAPSSAPTASLRRARAALRSDLSRTRSSPRERASLAASA